MRLFGFLLALCLVRSALANTFTFELQGCADGIDLCGLFYPQMHHNCSHNLPVLRHKTRDVYASTFFAESGTFGVISFVPCPASLKGALFYGDLSGEFYPHQVTEYKDLQGKIVGLNWLEIRGGKTVEAKAAAVETQLSQTQLENASSGLSLAFYIVFYISLLWLLAAVVLCTCRELRAQRRL